MNKNSKNPPPQTAFVWAMCVAGCMALVVCAAAVVLDVTSPIICVAIAAAVYAAAAVLIAYYMRAAAKKNSTAGGNVPDSILRDSVLNMNIPMLICERTSEKIIWYNKAAGLLGDGNPLFGEKFAKLFGISLEDASADPENGTEAECGVRRFRICGRNVGSGEKLFCILTLEDVTELRAAYDRAAARDTAIAYIIADNIDELAEYEKEKYRKASAKISSILTEWAQGCGAILKEYEHDKYLCLIEAEKLDENIGRKFDLLDRIRDIRVGESAVPITVSAGIANLGESASLLEKEKAARLALEMALQRGGDQVVVKGEASIEFYGGRTRTPQKRTKVRARVFANEMLMHMSRSSSVMVMGHRFADFDCFGAAVGIARLAMFCGVPVHIITDFTDSGMDVCRDIVSKEKDFEGVFVSATDALDMMESDMLLVIVDVNNMALVESREIAKECTSTVIIDHHRKIAEFEREPLMTYIEPAASAACELVAEMLEQCLPDGMLTACEANMLLAGIILDTKQFTRNTGTRTFSAALYLRGCGAEPSDVQELFKTTLDEFTNEGKFRSNVVIYRSMFAVALGDGEGESLDRIAAAKTADKLLSVEGVRASFALIKIGTTVHISARSSGQVNVQLILEQLRGGGHYDSAGAQVEAADISEALTLLKHAIDSYIDGDGVRMGQS